MWEWEHSRFIHSRLEPGIEGKGSDREVEVRKSDAMRKKIEKMMSEHGKVIQLWLTGTPLDLAACTFASLGQ